MSFSKYLLKVTFPNTCSSYLAHITVSSLPFKERDEDGRKDGGRRKEDGGGEGGGG